MRRLIVFILLIVCTLPTAKLRAQEVDAVPQRYVVVTQSDCLEALLPLLQWKRQCGYEVLTLVISSPNCDSIRQQLQALYLNATPLSPAPSFVLIVGDVDRIEAFEGRYKPSSQFRNHPTDLYYGEYTGDHLPEAMVGRLSIATPAELREVVTKQLLYEQVVSGNYLQRLLLVAGHENRAPAPTTTNGQVNYLKQRFSEHYPTLDTICFYNPSSEMLRDSLVAQISEGSSMVSYTAHCLEDGWLKPSYTIADIDTTFLQPRLYVNNCCLSNRYNEHCFGEQLLRKGDAIGVIGASNETLWEEDYFWAVGVKYPLSIEPLFNPTFLGAFDPLLNTQQRTTTGTLLHAGNHAVTQAGSPNAGYYWEIYNLLGDPSLMPYIGEPQQIALSFEATPRMGDGTLQFSGTPYARVAATCGNQLLGVVTLNENGINTLYLNHALGTDTLCVTATAPQHLPVTLYALPEIDTLLKASLLKTTYTTHDGLAMSMLIKNCNSETLYGHQLTIENNTYHLPPLAMGDSVWITHHRGMPIGNESYYSTLCYLSNGDSTYAHHLLQIDVAAQHPTIKLTAVEDPYGNAVSHLSVGDEYQLKIVVTNPTDSLCHLMAMGEIETIAAHENNTLSVPFVPTHSAAMAAVTWHATCSTWSQSDTLWLPIGESSEEWEQGDFTTYPWQNNSPLPWMIDSSTYHSGARSAKSGAIGKLQSSTLKIEIETLLPDTLSFWRKVACEEGDKLLFRIDDSIAGTWSGNRDWLYRKYPLQPGRHTLTWSYTKDGSGNLYQDCAWIDDIRFPLSLWQEPCGTTADSLGIVEPLLLNEIALTLYPNPAQHQVWLHNESPLPCYATLYDALGRKVTTSPIIVAPHSTTQYSVQGLRFGVYTFMIEQSSQRTFRKMLITH